MMKHYVRKTALAAATGIVFLLIFLSLSGASVWEGAAAVSSGGEFPDSGFYVATNSFPRNTVVDITNLETGKTVRGIVAANLDSPGLLALISRECAEAIGLQSRSIGRIRMIQPADPIAFSRFGEESLSSGDPDYDPEAALKAYGQAETGAQIAEPAVEAAADSLAETAAGADSTADSAAESATPPVVAVIPHEPEKIPEDSGTADETPVDETPESVPVENPSETAVIAAPVTEPAEVPVKDPVQPQGAIEEKAETAGYSEPETAGAVVVTALPEETPPEEAETVLAEAAPEESIPETAYPEESAWYTPEEGSVFTLVPAEERPPAAVDTVPEITEFLPAEETPVLPVYPAEEPAVRVYNTVPGVFSVPSVGELEPGKYYLQLGAYSETYAVEREITKIEKNLPLAVQCTGSAGKPVYRILVGPVNHGESGALLQRFRGIGYKDAFVRRGE
jgi:hypothetical protein